VSRRPKGFACPHCGGPMIVIRSRKRANKIVVRRRKCKVCKHRVTTDERPRAA
jgi:transcriptional regulator NrdR family protein